MIDALPESGMGYHVLDLILADGQVLERVTVINAEEAELPPRYSAVRPEQVKSVRPSEFARLS